MKKIRIDVVVSLGEEKKSSVGEQLFGLLESMPTSDAKTAVRQIMLADELQKLNDKKGSWLSFEDSDQAAIEAAVEKGASMYPPRIIAPIRIALDEAVAYKAEEPTDATTKPKKAA